MRSFLPLLALLFLEFQSAAQTATDKTDIPKTQAVKKEKNTKQDSLVYQHLPSNTLMATQEFDALIERKKKATAEHTSKSPR